MPLSTPANRELIHERKITMQGYEREDGQWDIEGHLTDVKTYDFDMRYRDKVLEAGEYVHEMWLRLTVNNQMEITDVETATDASPYPICVHATQHFKELIGERIQPGWNKKVRDLLGGIKGCTHHVELLGPMATVAFQTIFPLLNKRKSKFMEKISKRPLLLNSCHAYAENSPVVEKLYPDFYRGDK